MGWRVRNCLVLKALPNDCFRKTQLILDKEGRIIATLVGQPDDPEWMDVARDAANVFQDVQRLRAAQGRFSDSSLGHRRGEFLSIPVGVSFGGGQQVRALPRHSCGVFQL
jgi:hypothetical protein